MDMVVNKKKLLKELQEDFQQQFPFLKIEFYSGFHKQGEGSDKRNKLNSELTVGEVCKLPGNESSITINGSMKVSEFEQIFKTTFGLSVQVFRKSNNLWLQTTITDGWSLSKQNQSAMEMNAAENSSAEPEDYHEQE